MRARSIVERACEGTRRAGCGRRTVSHAWTCSALQMHPRAIIVCDEAATAELKVGTWKYFKDIESAHLDPACLVIAD